MKAKQALKECQVFATLGDQELEKIASLVSEKEYEAGTFIFEEGNNADELFVLKEGKIALQMTLQHGQMSRSISVDIVAQNEVFGWSAIVEPHIYTLSAVCLQKAKVLSISSVNLRWLLSDNPNICCEVMQRLIKVVASRLEDTRRVLISERLLPTS